MITVQDYFWCLIREKNDDEMGTFIKSFIGLMKNDGLAKIIYNIDNDVYSKVYSVFDLEDNYDIEDEKKKIWFMDMVRRICYQQYIINLEPYDYINDDMGNKIPVDENGNYMDIEKIRDEKSENIILKGVFTENKNDNKRSLSRSNSF